jgi:radical SAM protein with 4Fe4S-binding SPASM domain
MSAGTFGEALDFLERSGMAQARLLGGEPTLHPEFGAFIHMAARRGLDLLLFSNGLMPEPALRTLEEIPADQVHILINVTDAGTTDYGLSTRQREVFSRLGDRIMLGFNIYSPAADFYFLLDVIRKFDLFPNLRLGIAHPCINRANQHLHPRHYNGMGDKIIKFALRTREAGIKLELDCGFVPCMFSEEGLKILRDTVTEIGRRCSPILDMLPDGRVVPCYPLSALCSIKVSQSDNAKMLRGEFERRLSPYRQIGIFRECSSCGFFTEGLCYGGCLAAAMRRLQGSKALFTMAKNQERQVRGLFQKRKTLSGPRG